MTVLEPVVPSRLIPHPVTGEAVDLAGPTDLLGEQLNQLRRLEQDAIGPFKRALAEELLDRMDHAARWTVRANGLEITGDGPGRVEYDAEALYGALGELVADGVISQAALDEAVEVVTTFKARKRGIQALQKLGGVVADAIAEHEQQATRPRAVRVKELAR